MSLSLFLSVFFLSPAWAAEPTPKVLVIGIDGCRPDALKVADTPNLDALIDAGIWFSGTDIRKPDATDKANTISGPGWSNLLTGVWPDKHHVLGNKFSEPNYERYPHIFVRLKEIHPDAVTASFSTWAPIEGKIVSDADVSRSFSKPKSSEKRSDAAVAACVEYLETEDPDLVFCYQGHVDGAGHGHGFHPTVPEYISAIESTDKNIGKLVAAVKARPHFADEDWLTIVCTDHGGEGTRHGGGHSIPEVRRTFMIVSGPAAQRGTSDAPTFQVDMVPTALSHLNVTALPEWELDGHPIGLKKTAETK